MNVSSQGATLGAVAGNGEGLAEWAADTADAELSAEHPQPEGHKVLLRPMASKSQKDLGNGKTIFLPDMAKEANELMTCVSEVIAVGPGAYHDRNTGQPWAYKPGFKVGDHVVTAKYAGQRITYRGVKLVFVNDDEILGTAPDPEGVVAYV